MRIHYLASSELISNTANAVHVTKMCQAFVSVGHELVLISSKGGGSDEEVFRYFGISARYPLCRHEETDHPIVRALWEFRKYFSWIRVGGLPSMLYGYLVLRPQIRSNPPDLVYARNLDWLFSMPSDIPFVAESHRPPRNLLEREIERLLYRRAGFRRLVVISESLKYLYTGIFPWLSDRIFVAHDAADDPGEVEEKKMPERINVGYVGHLYKGRGTDIIRFMAHRMPDVMFHIVGGTPEDSARFAASGLSANVILHGHRPPSELAGFYRDFDFVLAPYERKVTVGGSRGDTSAYMSPLKIFEYMSWAKVILCSDMPVLREVLDDGRNAIMLPPDDPEAWVAALARLIKDQKKCQGLALSARQDFLAKYTWTSRAKNVLRGVETGEHVLVKAHSS